MKVIITDAEMRALAVLHRYESKLMLPGGGVRRRESPLEAAIREIREELGLDLDSASIAFLGEYQTQAEGKRDSVTLFTAPLPVGSVPRAVSYEIADIAWVSVDDPRCSRATQRRLREFASGLCAGGLW